MRAILLRAIVLAAGLLVLTGVAPYPAASAVPPQLTASQSYSCGLSDAGTLSCWGSNQFGELGRADQIGTTNPNPVPAPVAGLPAVKQMASGVNYGCAVSTIGAVHCWGTNFSGEQGNSSNNGSFVADATPQEVAGLPAAAKVAAAVDHTCAVTDGHELYCWGSNEKGQLGNLTNYGSTTANPAPALVALPAGVTDVALGYKSTCALLITGATYCFGLNENGQLGNATGSGTPGGNPAPLLASLGPAAALMAPSYMTYHFCAVLVTGALSCWGANGVGQLGNPTNYGVVTPNVSALPVSGIASARGVATAPNASCALLPDRTVYCWGNSDYGNLARAGGESPTPQPAAGISQVFALGMGLFHSCAVERGGNVKCFGSNGSGQLGSSVDLGVVTAHPTPAAVAGLDLVTTAYAPSNVILRLNSSHPVHRGKTSNAPITFLMQPNEIVDPAEACTGKVTVTSYYMKKRKNKRKRLRKRVRRSASLLVKNIGGVDNCVARTTIKLPFRAVKGKRQKFTASFAGNGSVTPVSAKFKVRMPRR